MYLEIVTPDDTLFSGNISYVNAPGTKGSFGILKGHAPLISTLDKGFVILKKENGSEQEFEVKGGVIEVLKDKIVILATV